jgi:formylmethanofuran dehydrogenase subunit A
MSERLLLKGGRVIDPGRAVDGDLDLLLVDGEVADLGTRVAARGAEILDVAGLVVCPGSSTSTPTCASPAARTRRRSPRARARPPPAASPRSARCRTRSR